MCFKRFSVCLAIMYGAAISAASAQSAFYCESDVDLTVLSLEDLMKIEVGADSENPIPQRQFLPAVFETQDDDAQDAGSRAPQVMASLVAASIGKYHLKL